jgi:hypothetical protein
VLPGCVDWQAAAVDVFHPHMSPHRSPITVDPVGVSADEEGGTFPWDELADDRMAGQLAGDQQPT